MVLCVHRCCETRPDDKHRNIGALGEEKIKQMTSHGETPKSSCGEATNFWLLAAKRGSGICEGVRLKLRLSGRSVQQRSGARRGNRWMSLGGSYQFLIGKFIEITWLDPFFSLV
eukprot:15986_3